MSPHQYRPRLAESLGVPKEMFDIEEMYCYIYHYLSCHYYCHCCYYYYYYYYYYHYY